MIPTIQLLPSGYYHVRWSREVWAQWPSAYWAPREVDFFGGTGTPERIREAVACVNSLLRAAGKDPIAVYEPQP